MSENTGETGRTRCDFIGFGVTFFGFVLAAAGMVVNSIPAGLLGVAMVGVALAYFVVRRSDLD